MYGIQHCTCVVHMQFSVIQMYVVVSSMRIYYNIYIWQLFTLFKISDLLTISTPPMFVMLYSLYSIYWIYRLFPPPITFLAYYKSNEVLWTTFASISSTFILVTIIILWRIHSIHMYYICGMYILHTRRRMRSVCAWSINSEYKP